MFGFLSDPKPRMRFERAAHRVDTGLPQRRSLDGTFGLGEYSDNADSDYRKNEYRLFGMMIAQQLMSFHSVTRALRTQAKIQQVIADERASDEIQRKKTNKMIKKRREPDCHQGERLRRRGDMHPVVRIDSLASSYNGDQISVDKSFLGIG